MDNETRQALAALHAAVNRMNDETRQSLATLQATLNVLHVHQIHQIIFNAQTAARFSSLEQRLDTLLGNVDNLQATVNNLQATVSNLQATANDHEDQLALVGLMPMVSACPA